MAKARTRKPRKATKTQRAERALSNGWGDSGDEFSAVVRQARRGAAHSALSDAFTAWFRESSDAIDAGRPDPFARSLAVVLQALHEVASVQAENDDALLADRGPERWARSVLGTRAVALRRADAAEELLALVQRRLRRYGAESIALPDDAIGDLVAGAANWLHVVGAAAGIVTTEGRNPTRAKLDAMTREVRRVCARSRYDAKALAVALLKGWGLTGPAARDVMKRNPK